MKNKTKLTVAAIMLASGLVIADGIQYSQHQDSYDNQLKKEISQMSETQLQSAIKECDIALKRLQQIINSNRTDPEERFEARRAHESINQKRAQLQDRLDKITASQNATINFHDINHGR